MRDRVSPGKWLSWLTVSVGGAAMVGVFALAGGVGGGQSGVGSAVAAETSSSTAATGGNPAVAGVSTPSCAGSTLTGAIRVDDKFQGTITVGLFAISDPEGPLVRSFTDTGMRATVTFNNALRGQFMFKGVPEGPGGFLIAVIPASGTIDPDSDVAESEVIPSCNTATTTVTATQTETNTTTDVVTYTLLEYGTTTNHIVDTQTLTCVVNSTTTVTRDRTDTDTTTAAALPIALGKLRITSFNSPRVSKSNGCRQPN